MQTNRTAGALGIFVVIVMVSACAAYVPGEKVYWDARVREMCAKDGGVQIFDKLHVSPTQVSTLSRANGMFNAPMRELADPKSPAYTILTKTVIHGGNPSVSRSTADIIRRSNGALIARSVVYTRVGGDIPTHAHPSSFECPDVRKNLADLQPLFVFAGEAK
jgi:hypothetical protein